jgi:hypothetical protein
MNWTTLEAGPLWKDNIVKNHSFKHNWCLVMGNNPWLWFIPISGTTDPVEGLDYKGTIAVNRPAELEEVKDELKTTDKETTKLKLSFDSSGEDEDERTGLLA